MSLFADFYELIRTKITVSAVVSKVVKLHKKSSEYLGLCPFHSEKTPSFTVNDAKKFYHCFGCGANGDVIKFTSNLTGLSYKQAANKLADDYGIDLPKLDGTQQAVAEQTKQLRSILEIANEFFQSAINDNVTSYLNNRNITSETAKEFGLGFSPSQVSLQKLFEKKAIPMMLLAQVGLIAKNEQGDTYNFFRNRITFPIKDTYGRIIAFGGRVMGDSLPKYINSPETVLFKKNETLYGENIALAAARGTNYVILVEGYMDVIALHQYGFKASVATLGTAVTDKHIVKLWNLADEIITCFDGDEAGRKARERLISLILPTLNASRKVSFIELPKNTDPDELLHKNGKEAFSTLLNNKITLSELMWQEEVRLVTSNTPEEIAKLEAKLEQYLQQIHDKTLSSNYRKFFKDRIWHTYFNNKNKTTKYHAESKALNLPISNKHSEQELIEYAILSLIIKAPLLITNLEVQEFLLKTRFTLQNLQNLIEVFCSNLLHLTEKELEKYDLATLCVEHMLIDTYTTLIQNENFLYTVEINSKHAKINYLLLLKILCKKYEIISLKNEFNDIIQNHDNDQLIKARFYQSELLVANKILQELTDLFFNQ